jgi:hypothetical protein
MVGPDATFVRLRSAAYLIRTGILASVGGLRKSIARWLPAFAAVLATTPAMAAGGAPTAGTRLIQARALLHSLTKIAARDIVKPAAPSLLPRLPAFLLSPPKHDRSACNVLAKAKVAGSAAAGVYDGILRSLVIARDLGNETVGLRLIPTSTALAGESSAVVFRPRVMGTTWVGMDVAARF